MPSPDCIPVVVLRKCGSGLLCILNEVCWKAKKVGERSTSKIIDSVSLVSVVSKVFEELGNNRLSDHLKKCVLFSDFHYGCMVPGLLGQLQVL